MNTETALTEAEIAELERLAVQLRTQDNAITSDPIFVVQQKLRHVGFDAAYEEDPDRLIWVNSGAELEVTKASDPGPFASLQAGNFGDDDADDWDLFGFTETWEFVQPFFTREAAEAYRKREAHNLGETRVYVESAYRSLEWKALRGMLSGPLLSAAKDREELVAWLDAWGQRTLQVLRSANEYTRGSEEPNIKTLSALLERFRK